MNARKMKKQLKKQITALESDNDLMRRIIANDPSMQERYDLFFKPLDVTYSTLQFREYKETAHCYNERLIPVYKNKLANDLFKGVKDNVIYDVNTECEKTTITASIFVAKK